MKTRSAPLLLALALALPAACSDSDPALPSDVPATHTVVKDGVRHAPGLQNATQSCTSCHGADLRGGSGGQPSCYTCHGKKWT
jgi:hypothetical protein